MATQTLAPTVMVNEEIDAAWGNQVHSNLDEVYDGVVAGTMLVGDDTRSFAVIALPSGAGTYVLKITRPGTSLLGLLTLGWVPQLVLLFRR